MKAFLLILAFSFSAGAVVIRKDITYSGEQKLDMYSPDRPGKKSAIIFLHGGGWAYGSKDGFHEILLAAVAKDFISLAINYRLSVNHPWPAQLEDVLAAIAWARKDSSIGKIFLAGESAGAHLALMAGMQDENISGILNLYGPTNLNLLYETSPDLQDLIVLTFGKDSSKWNEASPVKYLGESLPPILTIHGTADTIVPYSQALQLGSHHELITITGEGHGLTPDSRRTAFENGFQFFLNL